MVHFLTTFSCDGATKKEPASGVLLVADGRIATAYHVLHPLCGGERVAPAEVKITIATESFVAFDTVAEDEALDFAVIQVPLRLPEGETPQLPELGDPAGLTPRMSLTISGFPPSLRGHATTQPVGAGIYPTLLDATRDCFYAVESGGGEPKTWISLEREVAGGYSGGPVVEPGSDLVVGLVSRSIEPCTSGQSKRSLATPARLLARAADLTLHPLRPRSRWLLALTALTARSPAFSYNQGELRLGWVPRAIDFGHLRFRLGWLVRYGSLPIQYRAPGGKVLEVDGGKGGAGLFELMLELRAPRLLSLEPTLSLGAQAGFSLHADPHGGAAFDGVAAVPLRLRAVIAGGFFVETSALFSSGNALDYSYNGFPSGGSPLDRGQSAYNISLSAGAGLEF